MRKGGVEERRKGRRSVREGSLEEGRKGGEQGGKEELPGESGESEHILENRVLTSLLLPAT